MALTFQVGTQGRYQPTPASTYWWIDVVVKDDDWPDAPCDFGIAVLVHPDGYAVDAWIERVAIGRLWLDVPSTMRIQVGQLRDLPFTRWGTAAANVALIVTSDVDATRDLEKMAKRPGRKRPTRVVVTQDDLAALRQNQIDRLLATRYPDLSDKTPRDARRAATIRKFAEIAVDYRVRLAAGSADPAGELAEEYGATASTVRVWVYRARQMGFLVGSADIRGDDEDRLEFDYGVLYNDLETQRAVWCKELRQLKTLIRIRRAGSDATAAAGFASKRDLDNQIETVRDALRGIEAQYAGTRAAFDELHRMMSEHRPQEIKRLAKRQPMPATVRSLIAARRATERVEEG